MLLACVESKSWGDRCGMICYAAPALLVWFNQFIVHTKQEKGVSGVATSGCLAFCTGVIGVPWGWRCIIKSCRLSSEEVIGVIAP